MDKYSDLLTKYSNKKGCDNYVDARDWGDSWIDGWVAFIDLCGFADRCNKSDIGVTNQIVRFHRAVSAAQEVTACTDLRVYRFTDCVYVLSKDLWAVLAFTANFMHDCLARSESIFKAKSNSLAEFALLPRATIASGRILNISNLPAANLASDFNSVDALAGSAIVAAYKIEKSTSAMMIAVRPIDAAKITSDLKIRGNVSKAKSALCSWIKSVEDGRPEFFHDDIVDIPWAFFGATQKKPNEIWACDKSESTHKLRYLLELAEKMEVEFVARGSAISISKHFSNIKRHVYYCGRAMMNGKKLKLENYISLGNYVESI